MRNTLNHIVYANVIVAASTATLTSGVVYRMGSENWWLYGLMALFSTLAVYNGQRLFKSGQPQLTPWLVWVKRNERNIFLLVVLCSFLASMLLYVLLKWKLDSLVVLIVSGILSSFYVIRLFGKNLREIAHVKIHFIALTWVLFLVAFPMINEGQVVKLTEVAISHYLYVLAVTIPFDIRDLKYDSPKQFTIPQILGVNGAKVMAVLLLLSFAILMPILWDDLVWNPLFYAAVIVQCILVIGMNESRSDLYCAGLIDGAIFLLGISYFFL